MYLSQKKTWRFLKVSAAILAMLFALSACATSTTPTNSTADATEAPAAASTDATTTDKGEPTEITYFSSKSATDETVISLQIVADMFNAKGGNIKFTVESAADRPSYDQKLRTMLTGGQVPDMYDLDPTPFTQELADAGLLLDMQAFLEEIGELDSYVPLSINYCRMPDGSLYTIPLEFTTEMIWYNTDTFATCGLEKPQTFDDMLNACKVLAENGYTPIAIDGMDGWPLLRHLAMVPFRLAGNDFLNGLASGETHMSDSIGMQALQFMADIGQYYQQGFTSTDYATAMSLFMSGKAAMYGIGTWELNNFIDANRPADLHIDYFYMPTMDGAVTQPNEYWAFGGIGLTANPEKFDGPLKDFFTFIVKNYSSVYLARQHFAPQKVAVPEGVEFDPLFLKIKEDIDSIGNTACRPWDVVLSADVISTINDNLPGLCMGEITPEEFAKIVDDALANN